MCDEWKNVILSDMFYGFFVSATDVLDCPDQVTYRISRIYLFMRLKKNLLFICLNRFIYCLST